jgi:hypothetical protein
VLYAVLPTVYVYTHTSILVFNFGACARWNKHTEADTRERGGGWQRRQEHGVGTAQKGKKKKSEKSKELEQAHCGPYAVCFDPQSLETLTLAHIPRFLRSQWP